MEGERKEGYGVEGGEGGVTVGNDMKEQENVLRQRGQVEERERARYL